MSTQPSALPRPPWPGTARSRSRPIWLPLLLLVAAAHLLLLQLAQQALRTLPTATTTQRAAALVLLPPIVAPLEPPAPSEPDAPKRRPRRLAKPAPSAPLTHEVAAPVDTDSATDAVPTAASSSPQPARAAAGGGLLDSEATRHAIREAARKPSIAEQGARVSGANAALSEPQRLGQEIARGAIGDCLKGEYAGAGMGLLSLPFWLMAELRDKCRR
jgi:hypothetical protein